MITTATAAKSFRRLFILPALAQTGAANYRKGL
jgi:hypothetical protein